MPQATSPGLSALTRLEVARGDLAAARSAAARNASLHQGRVLHPDVVYARERAQVIFWAAEQNWSALEDWARDAAHKTPTEGGFRYEKRLITLGRAWLALGRHGEAANLLRKLSKQARSGGRSGHQVEILALLSIAQAGRAPFMTSQLSLLRGQEGGR